MFWNYKDNLFGKAFRMEKKGEGRERGKVRDLMASIFLLADSISLVKGFH